MLALSSELILQGIAALLILAWALKDALKARREAITAVTPNPMVAAVSMAWDRDQQERLLQLVERLVRAHESQTKALEGIYKSQEVLANQQQAELQDRLDELLAKLDKVPTPRRG